MKPAPFDYIVPSTIDEALEALADADGSATILAGGQTLMPLLALRMSMPATIIDINRIAALKGVKRTDGGVRIGPMTRQNDVIADATLKEMQPVLVQATRYVGHHQTRNRGTIGGSIALGEPAAELPATAVALGARIEVRSKQGKREIPAEDLYLGPYMTALEEGELVTGLHFPDLENGSLSVFREVARRPGDFALVGLVGALTLKDGKIARAGLCWFGMGPTPMKLRQAEAALMGQDATSVDLRGVAELAIADADPFDDHHATGEYRRLVGKRVLTRSLSESIDAALGRQAA